MRAGELDRRVTIEKPVHSQSASGAAVTTWSVVNTVWAGKRDLKGKEFFDAQKENAEIETEFRLRWRSDVLAEWRIDARTEAERLADPTGGARYDIVSIAEIGRREGLLILATAPRS